MVLGGRMAISVLGVWDCSFHLHFFLDSKGPSVLGTPYISFPSFGDLE